MHTLDIIAFTQQKWGLQPGLHPVPTAIDVIWDTILPTPQLEHFYFCGPFQF